MSAGLGIQLHRESQPLETWTCATQPCVPPPIGTVRARGTIAADMTRVKRYLTNKKNITGVTLTVLCDAGACVPTQTYTLDDGDDPKSQTPV